MSGCLPPFSHLTFPKSRYKYWILTAHLSTCDVAQPPHLFMSCHSWRPGQDSKNAFLARPHLAPLPSPENFILWSHPVSLLRNSENSSKLLAEMWPQSKAQNFYRQIKSNASPPEPQVPSVTSLEGWVKGAPEGCSVLNCSFSKFLRKMEDVWV